MRREHAQRVRPGRLEPLERKRVGADPVAAAVTAAQHDGAVADRVDLEPTKVLEPAVERIRVERGVALPERAQPAGRVCDRVARPIVQEPGVAAASFDPRLQRLGPVASGWVRPADEHVREASLC